MSKLSFKVPKRFSLPDGYKTVTSIYGETLIEPHNDAKFLGNVDQTSSGKWRVKIVISEKSRDARPIFSFYEYVDDEQEARQIWKDTCMFFGLVRNKMIDKGNYVEMSLTDRATTKIDKDDISIADKYNWLCAISNAVPYARAFPEENGKKRSIAFHNLIMKHDPDNSDKITIDHINIDSLDNRKINLRLATKQEQVINQNKKPSSSGVVGIIEGI